MLSYNGSLYNVKMYRYKLGLNDESKEGGADEVENIVSKKIDSRIVSYTRKSYQFLNSQY